MKKLPAKPKAAKKVTGKVFGEVFARRLKTNPAVGRGIIKPKKRR